jgi:sigma-54-specific transcriptional regulator
MSSTPPILTLPEERHQALSIRAKVLLFHDPRSVALLQRIERVAQSDATALIIGETGTGKELVARHIHQVSRRKGPFLAVNCGAFTESLIDEELFGHEMGAYTGASGARAGWFEAADGGTLFLDEIGDLSQQLQVKLLRVLQERQVVRLGSRKPIAIDVRLIAATNVDLHKAVEAQNFRADLFYRLSVAPLQLPPLRERPGDILPLAEHFIELYSQRMGQQGITLGSDAEEALLAYPWPGNIRELENAIHFGLIVCRDGVVKAADLKLVSPSSTSTHGAPVPTRAGAPSGHGPATEEAAPAERHAPSLRPTSSADAIFKSLELQFTRLAERGEPELYRSVESTLVHAVYALCRENQVQSARVLGVTRNTLRTLLKQHGLLAVRGGGLDTTTPSSLTAV